MRRHVPTSIDELVARHLAERPIPPSRDYTLRVLDALDPPPDGDLDLPGYPCIVPCRDEEGSFFTCLRDGPNWLRIQHTDGLPDTLHRGARVERVATLTTADFCFWCEDRLAVARGVETDSFETMGVALGETNCLWLHMSEPRRYLAVLGRGRLALEVAVVEWGGERAQVVWRDRIDPPVDVKAIDSRPAVDGRGDLLAVVDRHNRLALWTVTGSGLRVCHIGRASMVAFDQTEPLLYSLDGSTVWRRHLAPADQAGTKEVWTGGETADALALVGGRGRAWLVGGRHTASGPVVGAVVAVGRRPAIYRALEGRTYGTATAWEDRLALIEPTAAGIQIVELTTSGRPPLTSREALAASRQAPRELAIR